MKDEIRNFIVIDMSKEDEIIKEGYSKFWDDPECMVPDGYHISHVHNSPKLVRIFVQPDD